MRPLAQFAALATLPTATLRDVRIADPEAPRYPADVAAADCLTGPQRTAGAASERSHLLCPYPQRALFDGKGRDAEASRFTCNR